MFLIYRIVKRLNPQKPADPKLVADLSIARRTMQEFIAAKYHEG